MNFDRMRGLLIDRALQGQLVSNSHDAEPIDCSNEGKLPFDIPKNWRVASLENITTKITDGEHKTPRYQTDGVPFLSVKNISSGKVSFDEVKYITKEDYEFFSRRCNPEKGDLLITKVGTTGVPAIVPDEREFSLFVSIALLKLNASKVFNEYLYYVVLSNYFQKHVKATTRGLNKNWVIKEIKATLVPLPPLEEQRAIVKRLKELFFEIDCAEKAYQELQTLSGVLRGQILQKAIQGQLVTQLDTEPSVEMIGDVPSDVPFAIPEKWKWCYLGSVIEYGKSNQVPGDQITSQTWVLDLEDIEKNTGRLLEKKRGVSSTSNKNKFEPGYVLYSKLRPYLNKVVVADEAGVCTTEIVPINVNGAAVPLDAKYLQTYLMSPFFVNYANQASYGVKMPRLGTKDARAALIPIPPLEEQKRIVQKVVELLSQTDSLAGC